MSFPRYPEYKPSGVAWPPEIPVRWTSQKLGHLCQKIGSGKTPSGGSETYVSDGVVFIRSQNVHDAGLSLDDVVYISETVDEEMRGSRVQDGDVLLNITGASLGRSCIVPHGQPPSNVNQHVCLIRLSDVAHRDFTAWCMKSHAIQSQITLAQTGAAREGLNFAQIAQLQLALPPADERNAISVVLARETAKIDALIAEQHLLVKLLQEKRQAVISQTVTKGLNPDAPMKPSGIEWLGDVPTHWNVLRLKHVSPQVTVGIVVEPSKFYVDEGVPALRSLNISPGAISLENTVFISAEANEVHSKSCLRAGDLVAVRSGQPGTTAIVPEHLDGCNCIDLIIIRKPRFASERYLCWYLASDIARGQFSAGSGGAIQQHFNVSTANDLLIVVPPTAEQIPIADFLDRETRKLDDLTSNAKRAVELLQERRAALISAAVTGEVDVRGLVVSEGA